MKSVKSVKSTVCLKNLGNPNLLFKRPMILLKRFTCTALLLAHSSRLPEMALSSNYWKSICFWAELQKLDSCISIKGLLKNVSTLLDLWGHIFHFQVSCVWHPLNGWNSHYSSQMTMVDNTRLVASFASKRPTKEREEKEIFCVSQVSTVGWNNFLTQPNRA